MLTLAKGAEIKGRYVVHDVIGTGGYASVWRASDKELDRDVALKRLLRQTTVLSAESVEALKDEAQKNARLIHPNIVQIYDIVEVENEPLLVLEYIDGPSLNEILRDKATKLELFSLDRAAQLMRDILYGLACAHEAGICHRDLSPMNILVTSAGVPKVADFGIARVLADRAAGQAQSSTSAQGGTGNPNFMSPEQARGEAADFASDLFMAGIIGYLLLAGKHPFSHPSGLFTIPELLRNADYSPESPKPAVTYQPRDQQLYREYAAVVMRLLHRERAGRYANAREAADAIDDVTPYLECPHCFERVPEHHKWCGLCGKSLEVAPSTKPVAVLPARPTAEDLVDEGFALARAKNWSAAIAKYEAALAIEAGHTRALWNLAFAHNRSGRHAQAEEVASRGLAVAVSEHKAGLYYERSFARSNLKRFEEAVADIDRALNLQPRSTKFLYFKARINQYRGARDNALRDAEEVLRREPSHTGAFRIVHGAA